MKSATTYHQSLLQDFRSSSHSIGRPKCAIAKIIDLTYAHLATQRSKEGDQNMIAYRGGKRKLER